MQEANAYQDLVARNVRSARARVEPKLSQTGLAGRMRELGFKDWRRQTVGSTESGSRRLAVEEVLGLCVALGCPLSTLLLPPTGREYISLPGGRQVWLEADARLLGLPDADGEKAGA